MHTPIVGSGVGPPLSHVADLPFRADWHARGCGSFGMAIQAVHVVSDTGASPLRHAQVQGGGSIFIFNHDHPPRFTDTWTTHTFTPPASHTDDHSGAVGVLVRDADGGGFWVA